VDWRPKSKASDTGIAVVLAGKYLSRFELRWPIMLWKSLWNAGCEKNAWGQSAMTGITLQCFTPCKALSSNQLGNSLAINIAEIQTAPINS
jgi:hypothetical protein